MAVGEWYWGVSAFVAGYVLQWIGHLVEGNDLGEWAAVKRMLGLPYVVHFAALAETRRGHADAALAARNAARPVACAPGWLP